MVFSGKVFTGAGPGSQVARLVLCELDEPELLAKAIETSD